MKILMVSPFPPLRDGVGKYAAQEVRWLRDQGHEVEVLAPTGCAAHHVEDLKGGLRFARVRRYARRYDRAILEYQPSHFHARGSGFSRIVSNLAMAWVFWRTPNLTVVCHEVEYPPPSWPSWRPETVLQRFAWSRARDVQCHTEREVRALAERLGARPRNVSLRAHGGHFRAAVTESRELARDRLGVGHGVVLFLCIGFIQRHKGFDRAVRALRRIPAPEARLAVVGSIRSESDHHRGYLDELESLVAADERVSVFEGMVPDEEFDRWICAADVVVLPYREIWSSGVFERAKLLDRPVITTDVGGMADQARPEDVVVADDEGLARAMAAACGSDLSSPASASMDPSEAQAVVEAEAVRRRGPAVPGPALGEAVHGLAVVPRVHPVVLASTRPLIGPALTFVKRVLRRAVGWYAVPMLGQINTFEDRAVDAVREIADGVAAIRAVVDDLADKTGAMAWEQGSHRHHHETTEPRWAGMEDRVGRVERRTRGLVDALAAGGGHTAPAGTSSATDYTAIDYHGFEDAFRGAAADVREAQRERYLELFRDAGPVIDAGCGRGEFLEVLRDAGVQARGVDIDLDMVATCRDKGLDVTQGDAIAFLGSLEPASVGGVFAAQVVEHLAPRAIVALLAAARRALRPGGLVVLETINPSSLYALANWYTMDLTHSQPVHSETLRFLARQEGFAEAEIRFFAPVRSQPPAPAAGNDAPRWASALVGRLEAELARLEEVVFGPQDYALIARA